MVDSWAHSSVVLLAQAEAAREPSPWLTLLLMFGPLILLFWLLIIRPQQRRERERKKMLASLKKNDHVVTYGGLKGVVVAVNPEEDEVVLRVDESTGTKVRVAMSGIAYVAKRSERESQSS